MSDGKFVLFDEPVGTPEEMSDHVLARDAVAVNIDSQGVGVQWSEISNATEFAENLIRARCEGRSATSAFAPLGVVVGDLTA